MGWTRPAAGRPALCAAVCIAGTMIAVAAQQSGGNPSAAADAQGGDGSSIGLGSFAAFDRNVDGAVTRAELKATIEKWFAEADRTGEGSVTERDLGLAVQLPAPRLPIDSHVQAMLAALPDRAPAKPRQPRRVLVLNKTAGFIHTPIPLTAKMIESFGTRTKSWSTTVTYDPADINAQNLKQYDAVVLNSTTGAFLDDPNDAAATDARKKALVEFVRGGKGLVGIHGAGDSYHKSSVPPVTGPGRNGGGVLRRTPAMTLAAQMLNQGDTNGDQKLSKAEAGALADGWFLALDTAKTSSVRQGDFVPRFTALITPPPAPRNAGAPEPPMGGMAGMNMGGEGGRAPAQGRDTQVGTWPEFNRMIGGFFKFHFANQPIAIAIDDPKSPLTAMFTGPQEFTGEIYTFSMDTWSRENLHVLTSVDYAKMSDADKAKENFPRSDHDYGLTWVRREGDGRVFYFAFGNEERAFFIKPLNAQLLAGIQYALGDLKVDDAPGAKSGTK